MTVLVTLLLLVCYGLAAYLGWLQRTPIYAIAIVAGHIAALASPLWASVYGVSYSPGFGMFETLLGQPVPAPVALGLGWYYSLPALIVFYLYTARWWFPGGVTGLLTLLVFFLYHLLLETVGLRLRAWSYAGEPLPLSFSKPLLAAFMSSLVSYGLLYALLAVYRSSWQSLLVAILPAPLLLSLLVHGLLGAPLWASLALAGEPWAVLVGLLSTLMLLAWAAQIFTGGIRRLAT